MLNNFEYDELKKLPTLLHDATIIELKHSIIERNLTMILDDGKVLSFLGLTIFRSESYFIKDFISSDKLYICECEISHKSWLINQALSQLKPDGQKKWGDTDLKDFGIRKFDLIHINLYCVDWEFDIVCEKVQYG